MFKPTNVMAIVFATAIATVVLTWTLLGGAPVHAQGKRSAACAVLNGHDGTIQIGEIQGQLNMFLSSGKTNFMQFGSYICAW